MSVAFCMCQQMFWPTRIEALNLLAYTHLMCQKKKNNKTHEQKQTIVYVECAKVFHARLLCNIIESILFKQFPFSEIDANLLLIFSGWIYSIIYAHTFA